MAQLKTSIILDLKNRLGGPLRQLTSQVKRRTANMRASFGRLARQVKRVGIGLAAAAGVAAGALTAMTISLASKGDEAAKFARQIGFGVEALQEYSYAGERVGLSQSTLNQSLGAFSKRLGEARGGTGALVTYLKKSNPELLKQITHTDSLEEAFKMYLKAIHDAPTQIDKAALASSAFSRAGLTVVRMADAGADEIDRLRQRAQELGIVMSEKTTRDAEKFQDSLLNVKESLTGVKTIIGSALMPAFINIMDRITTLVIKNQQKIKAWATTFAKDLPDRIRYLAKTVKNAVQTVQNMVDLIGGWKYAIGGVIAVMALPLVTAILGFVGALGGLATKIKLATGAKWLFNKAFAKNALGAPIGKAGWARWLGGAGAVVAAGAVGVAIGTAISKAIDGTDYGLKLSNTIGRGVDTVRAKFGNEEAQNRLDNSVYGQADAATGRANKISAELRERRTQELKKYFSGKPSSYDHIPLPDGVNPRRGGQTDVGGTLRIQIDQMGRARVRDVRKNGPMDIDVNAGPLMLGYD